jgi:pyruvate/2-oxoglutarate dehydrogenase complex dihydrolipoamide acyltransferase (E2) component
MRIGVKIPHQGLTTETVTIAQWYVKVGDAVREGMPLLSMESEKATLDVESPGTGVVTALLKQESEEAAVGEIVAYIER